MHGTQGNRIYGPKQCEINSEMVLSSSRRGKYPVGIESSTLEEGFAIYKEAKEKRLAEKYKSVLSRKAYEALITRTIEFND